MRCDLASRQRVDKPFPLSAVPQRSPDYVRWIAENFDDFAARAMVSPAGAEASN